MHAHAAVFVNVNGKGTGNQVKVHKLVHGVRAARKYFCGFIVDGQGVAWRVISILIFEQTRQINPRR